MKILHGMSNVAGQGSFSVKGLKALGNQAKLVLWRNNSFGYEYDRCLNVGRIKILYPYYIIKMFVYGIYAMFHYDYFHFHYSYSLFPFNFDLKFLKKLKKHFVMEFHGSDVRFVLSKDRGGGFQEYQIPEHFPQYKISCLKKIFKNTEHIILHDSELLKYLVGYTKKVSYVPLRIDVMRFLPSYPDVNTYKPVIVHAPTDIEVKGSQYIFDAIDKLRNKYDFEFVLVQDKTQEEAFALYQSADIIIDQLRVGTYGVFAIEAMAMGKPVISYISEDMKQEFPEELPLLSASIYDIEEKLEMLLKDGVLRNNLGKQGRKYATDYHDYRYVARLMSEIYADKFDGTTQLESFQRVKELKKFGDLLDCAQYPL